MPRPFAVSPLPRLVVTSPYGVIRTAADGTKAPHDGIDLEAAIGTPIRMPDHGTIEHTAFGGGCGQQMAIRLRTGVRVVLCHLSRVFVLAGQSVPAGEIIAETGDTGRTTGPHLHLSTRLINPDGSRGALIDPTPLLGLGGGPAALVLAAVALYALA